MRDLLRVFLASIAAIVCLTVAEFGWAAVAGGLPNSEPRDYDLIAILPDLLIVAILHLFVLALPLYALLNRMQLVFWWTAAIGGFVIGCIPIAIFEYPHLDRDYPIYQFTDADVWELYFRAVGMTGFFGIIGGLAFWTVLHLLKPPTRPQ